MAVHTRENWKRWREERRCYQARVTQGFKKDLEALKAHIQKLAEVAPKDEACWPVSKALLVIDDLKKQQSILIRYLEQLR